MPELFRSERYLLTNFLKEGVGIPPEIRKMASGLSIELSRFILQTPTAPASAEDVFRINRVPHLVHFAGEHEYSLSIEKYMSIAENKSLPVDPLLATALDRGSTYNPGDTLDESTGLTIFPRGSNHAVAVIIRKPQEPVISVSHFLNILAEEMTHASAPQAHFLREAQHMFPQTIPLDLFELVGRWVKFEFLEQYNPDLILPEEHDLLRAKKNLIEEGVNFEAFKNLYLRGIYKAN